MPRLADIDMRQWDEGPEARRALADQLGRAFASLGFAELSGHGVDARVTEPAFAAARALFALPEATKRRYHVPGIAGARGYTPFGTEHAKDQSAPDLKEFWHVGRELEGPAPSPELRPNVWPEEVPAFRDTMLTLYRALDDLGARVLSALALHLELPEAWFTPHVKLGNSILRPLHYPPITSGMPDGVRSAAHEDINLITLLVSADAPGLELRGRDGEWLAVDAAPGTIVCNVGDMLQRLTNYRLVSTTHRVVNPSGEAATRSRLSMPFFLHPSGDMQLASLPSCVSEARPDRHPEPLSAGEYLHERLVEIGLI